MKDEKDLNNTTIEKIMKLPKLGDSISDATILKFYKSIIIF